jgi:thioredoxin-related protein
MKNRVFLIVLVFLAQQATAQPDTPAYKRFPTVPPINILQPDSSTLTKEKLKHQPTIIMYFSPDCDHCQHQWEDMKKQMEKLKKYQIVMITHQPFDMMVEFYKKQRIASYANIKMGQDTKFVLPPFYQIKSLPYMALYDKNGRLVTTFEGNVKIDKLVGAFDK